ncbi:LppA family lipoprotein [Amycolatopsis suaedae]|nr:LppA family lipoprotein [Amycolatopsis suaedae]
MLVVLVLCGVLAGCDATDPFGSREREDVSLEDQFAELMRRPSVEEITRKYEEMQAKVREVLSASVQLPPWTRTPDPGYSSCNDFPAVDAWDVKRDYLDRWSVDQGVSPEQWKVLATKFKEVVAQWGFVAPELEVDKEGFRESRAGGEFGSKAILSTAGTKVILSVDTGCHLTDKAKRRGTPLTKPTY